MRIVSRVSLVVALAAITATPALSQQQSWQNRWYWGAQGSILRYKTPTMTNWSNAYGVGAHWFITKRYGGLYVSFEQNFYDDATSVVPNGLSLTGQTEVQWEHSQRWQAILYAVPLSGAFQLYLGGGFAIHNITDADTLNASLLGDQALIVAQDEINRRDSRAFLVFGGGLQLKLGRLAVFGDYQFMPASGEFLITSSQHAFIAGLRFALTSSSSEISTTR
jgi:hypothetical protein